jgi:nucleotide-binding universal stress UspA family protein
MPTTVLCAVDEHSQPAITLAAGMAKAFGSGLTILVVNQLLGSVGGKSGLATYAWDEAQLQNLLQSAAEAARTVGVSEPKLVSVKSRDVARAITTYAEDHGVDHIVVGTGNKGLATRLMIGSVSHDVVSRAHCSVTVAR